VPIRARNGEAAALNQSTAMDASTKTLPEADTVWAWLEGVCDPEIPVVNLREMGILREVNVGPDRVTVVITPTYSGCPAMSQMQSDVEAALQSHQIPHDVVVRLSPAWTTDWMTDEAKTKLRDYGIAPPQRCHDGSSMGSGRESLLRFVRQAVQPLADVPCPRCGSLDTVVSSEFGSTACKSLHRCLACKEPFDHFKAI
jgi:ring-1,2-phenylacetyl-CoA epoxidase subunit PaaD